MSYLSQQQLTALSNHFKALQKHYESKREELDENDPFPIYFQAQFRQLLYQYAPRTVFEYMARETTNYHDFIALVKATIDYFEITGYSPTSMESKVNPSLNSTDPGKSTFGTSWGMGEVPF